MQTCEILIGKPNIQAKEALDSRKHWTHKAVFGWNGDEYLLIFVVEFVVGSRPCSERLSSWYSGFPLSLKTNTSKFQFDIRGVPN